jgi:hypothetical protein
MDLVAENLVVSGVRVPWKFVPAVAQMRRRHPRTGVTHQMVATTAKPRNSGRQNLQTTEATRGS